jgi:AcrR family transcriptional regulator
MSSFQEKQRPARHPGRPREFDRLTALSAALEVFLRRGYVGSSVSELTRAMHISRPSLYACFGSKEALFARALGLHSHRNLVVLRDALNAPTAHDVMDALLREALPGWKSASGVGDFLGLLSCLPDDPDLVAVRDEIVARRSVVIDALATRFARAQEDGEVSRSVSPAALAQFVEAMSHAISTDVRSGSPTANIGEMIRMVLDATR